MRPRRLTSCAPLRMSAGAADLGDLIECFKMCQGKSKFLRKTREGNHILGNSILNTHTHTWPIILVQGPRIDRALNAKAPNRIHIIISLKIYKIKWLVY